MYIYICVCVCDRLHFGILHLFHTRAVLVLMDEAGCKKDGPPTDE